MEEIHLHQITMATDTSTDSEDVPDSFTCSICLDLLYKPVVLSCGHVSCFWCVHKSMNSMFESYCPICRHPYHHFPTISQTLHLLLLKLYPTAYKRREEQTVEVETKEGCFSPLLDSNAHGSRDHKEHEQGNQLDSSSTLSDSKSLSDPCLSITDVECSSCKQLLFRPVFLNCGHGYCETCISSPDVEVLKCQLCPSLHPTGVLKVCLELDHFLEREFPLDYALRRETVQLKQVQVKNENNIGNGGSCSRIASKKDFAVPSVKNEANSHSKIHYAVGCDYCGMYPIIGDRYKCADCFEKMGFDLCGECYNSSSKLPGRFNQQHTPEHKLELVDHKYPCIRPGRLAEFRIALTNYIGRTDITENESQDSPADTEGNAGNSSVLILLKKHRGERKDPPG